MPSSWWGLGSDPEMRKWALPGKCQSMHRLWGQEVPKRRRKLEPQPASQWVNRQLDLRNEEAVSLKFIPSSVVWRSPCWISVLLPPKLGSPCLSVQSPPVSWISLHCCRPSQEASRVFFCIPKAYCLIRLSCTLTPFLGQAKS